MFDNLREDWAACEQDIWRIGPNAVVLQDVPANFIVIGIPARTFLDHPTTVCDVPKTSRGSLSHDE